MLQYYDATVMRERVYAAATFSLSFFFFLTLSLSFEKRWIGCSAAFFSFPSEKPLRSLRLIDGKQDQEIGERDG
jgi:hypothetical protein